MTDHIESTLWYRKWNNIFFTLFLIIFSAPYIYCELTTAIAAEIRFLPVGMLLLLFFGWIRSIILLKRILKDTSIN